MSLPLTELVRRAKRVYLCGNGGSAANAMHIANDLFSCGIRAHALCSDVATLTAIGNDYGYHAVFSRQVQVYGEQGDLLIALSGSGKSLNIRAALGMAREKQMKSALVAGAYNELPHGLADHVIKAGANMQQAEDYQVRLGHDLLRELKGDWK